jgi:hypothetical protein
MRSTTHCWLPIVLAPAEIRQAVFMIGGVDATEIPDQHFSIDADYAKAVVSLRTVSTIAVVSLSGRECRDFCFSATVSWIET